MRLSRRALLAGAVPLAAGAAGVWSLARSGAFSPAAPSPIGGSIVGPSSSIGHLLRGGLGSLPAPTEETHVPVAIFGGGISGLSAGWKLDRAGFRDFRVFELEERAGGTAAYGETPVSAYPWGAHYVPVPGPHARAVRELFEELGVIKGRSPNGEPLYEERYLCFAPQERLYQKGRWREGLYPWLGSSRADQDELAAFRAEMSRYRTAKGADGRPAFALPIEASSRDPALLALDRQSMKQFLDERGYRSERLRWYVEYACRDDYGCTLANTSAWAGIFYYASRSTPDEGPDEGQVLTWPAGNGWLVKRLEERLGARIERGSLVCRVEPETGPGGVAGARADVFDVKSRRMRRIHSRYIVLALPKFVAKHLLPPEPGGPMEAFSYSPWVVANVSVSRLPQGRGAPPAWDNVFHDSESLGYITATHQHLTAHPGPSVLTWYMPLVREEPAAARARMLATPWETWRQSIVEDLSRGHPGIERDIRRIDVMLWGHAMVRPTPGFLWGPERQAVCERAGPILLAHSDMSGLPLFEEAQYRGVAAAEKALAGLGLKFESSL
ncbi:MAG: NAD(P)-binding protein [Candidatus Wallbacteria bacterium]|nr:NAD(P)-binding protein [Candidatus Wallbacteria bacterium]